MKGEPHRTRLGWQVAAKRRTVAVLVSAVAVVGGLLVSAGAASGAVTAPSAPVVWTSTAVTVSVR